MTESSVEEGRIHQQNIDLRLRARWEWIFFLFLEGVELLWSKDS